MIEVDPEDINELCVLSQIQCSEKEKTELAKSIQSILNHMKTLEKVDTTDVKRCNFVQEAFCNSLRNDVSSSTEKNELFLKNAPSHVGGMVRVPTVIKFD
tara:strand:+ start:273 stop:572 length:300 start_codon:yes stop_codon:yes gene_type:complete